MDDVVDLVKEKAGSGRKLAQALGITHQAVSQWKRVPLEHIEEIEKRWGIPREQLRPDVYNGRRWAAAP